MFGKINWNVVLDTALGTMADREDEYRKSAQEVLRAISKDRMEQISDIRQQNKNTMKEINQKIGLLKSEGLTDDMIKVAISTFGKDAFAVIASDIDQLKSNKKAYGYLKDNKMLLDMYKNRFNDLISQAGQGVKMDYDLDTAKASLLDELPNLEIPDIVESQFGFKYTQGTRDQIASMGKDLQNVPEYDSGAPVAGLSSMFSGILSQEMPEARYKTPTEVRKQVFDRLKKAYGNLRTSPTKDEFVTRADATQQEIEFINNVNDQLNILSAKYLEEREKIAPYELRDVDETAMSDQQVMDMVFNNANLLPSTDIDDEDNGSVVVTPAAFNVSLAQFMKNNSGSTVTQLAQRIQSIGGITPAQTQSLLTNIANGVPAITALKNAGVTLPNNFNKGKFNNLLKALKPTDRQDILKITGGAVVQPGTQTLPAQAGPSRDNLNNKPKEQAWDAIYKPYFNPDGTIIDSTTYDTDQKINDLLKQLQSQLSKRNPGMTL